MLGKKSVLDSLVAKRRALAAESDRNRIELAQEWKMFKHEVAHLATPVRTAGHYLSMGIRAVGIVLTLRRVWLRMTGANGNGHWAGKLLHAARAGFSFWPKFRFRAR
jgi:hypothetical protein